MEAHMGAYGHSQGFHIIGSIWVLWGGWGEGVNYITMLKCCSKW